jgi:transposase-like protein
LLEQIASEGFGFLPELVRIPVNAAMQIERQEHLGAGPYERSPERHGYTNGYKPETVKTRLGDITFDVPQVREGGLYPAGLPVSPAARAARERLCSTTGHGEGRRRGYPHCLERAGSGHG